MKCTFWIAEATLFPFMINFPALRWKPRVKNRAEIRGFYRPDSGVDCNRPAIIRGCRNKGIPDGLYSLVICRFTELKGWAVNSVARRRFLEGIGP